MERNQISDFPSTWVGGFAESDPAFAYPDPDLSSLDITDNLANIPRIQRQQKAQWPEFSWETIQGDANSRCFERFAHDISRIGYDDTGRSWSIICPQQGQCLAHSVCVNIEVTVTGQRGWVDEPNRQLAAGLGVEGKIWFSRESDAGFVGTELWKMFKGTHRSYPVDKEHAIRVTTSAVGDPSQPIIPLRDGESERFVAPEFARHPVRAWAAYNLSVQIGAIIPTGDSKVDEFNQTILDILNMKSGNMLQENNVLTWNIWATAPEPVDTEEWADHAEKWRKSIDANHGPASSLPRHFDGSEFKATENLEEELMRALGL